MRARRDLEKSKTFNRRWIASLAKRTGR